MLYYSVFTVIPTFFDSEGKVDIEAIITHINRQYNETIRKIVILGTTSETPTLSMDEKLMIAKNVWVNFHEDLDIVIGISGNNTSEVKSEAILLEPYCHSIMLSAPYYNKPSQNGIYEHFKQVINSVEKEFIIYNVPSRCGVNIEPTTVARLYKDFNQVKAIKEASGSIDQVMKIKSLCDINILSGDDALTLPFLAVGATGVISVVSNVIPVVMLSLVESFSSDIFKTQGTFYKYYELMKLCFCDSNPVPVKYMLSLKYENPTLSFVRLPLVELTNENKNKIMDEYNNHKNVSKLMYIPENC